MCLVLVHGTMQCSNVSVPWVVEAFDNGFLSVLLKATEILKRIQGFGAIVGALKIAIEEIIGTVTEVHVLLFCGINYLYLSGKTQSGQSHARSRVGPVEGQVGRIFQSHY